jgi:hypothetical protein
MLSVTFKPFMLGGVMLSVVMPSVVMLNVVAPIVMDGWERKLPRTERLKNLDFV